MHLGEKEEGLFWNEQEFTVFYDWGIDYMRDGSEREFYYIEIKDIYNRNTGDKIDLQVFDDTEFQEMTDYLTRELNDTLSDQYI